MKSLMSSNKRITVVSCILVFLVYAGFTGGVAVSNSHDFGGQRDVRLVDELKSDIALSPRRTSWGIPFLIYYDGSGPPYSLRLQIWDSSNSYVSIELTEIVMTYKDGEVVRRTDVWKRTLQPHTQYNSSSTGIIETEMMMLSDTVDALIVRHADVSILMNGHLIKSNGKKVEFSAAEAFEAESRFRVTTLWETMAGV